MSNSREHILMCNCAGCGKGLLAERYKYMGLSETELNRLAQLAFGGCSEDIVVRRVHDRPYCELCLIIDGRMKVNNVL